MLAQVGLAGRAWDKARDLPYGDRRALEIAVALAARPRIVFLDEPTSGLGAEATRRLASLIERLRERYTIVMIEHDMRFLFGLADRISVIHWGQVIAEDTPAELMANKWVAPLAAGRGRLMLDVSAIETFYGETQALFGASLARRRGRDRRAARPERRRQDHDDPLDPRPLAAQKAARSASTATTSRACRRIRSPASASAGCPTTGACSRR